MLALALQIPQNLLRKIFLIWEMYQNVFSQNKKHKLTEKNFLVPSAKKFDLK